MGDSALSRYQTGRILKGSDTQLYRIARAAAFDHLQLSEFGDILLENTTQSADTFLAGLDPHTVNTVPAKMRALLKYWITSAPAPTYQRYSGQLKYALEQLEKHDVVTGFQDYLDDKPAGSNSANGTVDASAAKRHGGSLEGKAELWRQIELNNPGIRSPLILNLAETNLPFSRKWREIFRRLPEVKDKVASQLENKRLACAYPYPEEEIRRMQSYFLIQNSDKIDSDCLVKVLNEWLDDCGGHATVGHLWDVLQAVKLRGAAERFFEKFFC